MQGLRSDYGQVHAGRLWRTVLSRLDDASGGHAAVQPVDDGPGDLLRLVWRARFAMFAGAILGFAIASLLIYRAPQKYVAEMIITQAPDNARFSVAGSAGLAAAASLTGLNLPDTGDPNFFAVRQLLNSPRVVDVIDREHQLRRKMFADRWDATNRRWVEAPGFVPAVRRTARSVLDKPEPLEPSIDDTNELIGRYLSVSEIERSGFYLVAFEWPEPQLAMDFLRWSMAEADGVIREDARRRLEAQILNLERRLRLVTLAEHRGVLSNLLGQQERQLMLMASNEPFSLQIVQPPVVNPQRPQLIRNWAIGVIGGALLGFMLWLAWTSLRRR